MRWLPGGRSNNLEDQRGNSSGGGGGGGFGGGRLGIGGVVVLLVLSFVFKRDLLSEFGGVGGADGGAPVSANASAPVNDASEEKMVQFVSFVFDTLQSDWHRIVPRYTDAKIVLFRDAVTSACGRAEAGSGPFYCPGDRKVYVDLSFFSQLDRQFGAPGDFAQAYVLAHELGHHVQNVLGTERQVRALQQRDPAAGNQLSVALELQADCYAGVWAHSAQTEGVLQAGDIDEGLNAAAAVGDDRLQKMSTGRVNPETFTHGSSAARRTWFRRGFDSGDPNSCDTFREGK